MLVFGRWEGPWTLLLWGLAATIIVIAFLTVTIGRLFLRRRIRGQLDELAKTEITRRDDLIAELRSRMYRMELEDGKLRGMIRGMVSIGTGVTSVGNAAESDRPALRKVK